jgi:hypothetical protein
LAECFILVELCIHISNLFYLASFIGRDMLWLRILTVCGLVLGVIFFSCQTTPLYGPIAWQAAFIVINLYQIRRLVIDRRLLRLNEQQSQIARAAFEKLSREEMLNMLTRAMTTGNVSVKQLGQCSAVLNPEERIVRDIAFSRLSRAEILNLLTRRMWTTLSRWNPVRWRTSGKTVITTTISETQTVNWKQLNAMKNGSMRP